MVISTPYPYEVRRTLNSLRPSGRPDGPDRPIYALALTRMGQTIGLSTRRPETGRAAGAAVTGLLAGSLSLARLPTLAADPTAAMVGEFRRHHPRDPRDLAAPQDTDDLFTLVESGSCELGVTDALDAPDPFAVISLGVQELVFDSFLRDLNALGKMLSKPWRVRKYLSSWARPARRLAGFWTSKCEIWVANHPSP